MYSSTVEGRLLTLQQMMEGLLSLPETMRRFVGDPHRVDDEELPERNARIFFHMTDRALQQLQAAGYGVVHRKNGVEVQFSEDVTVHAIVKHERIQSYLYDDGPVFLRYDMPTGVLDVVEHVPAYTVS